jgi:hypothetical protein
MSADFDIQPMVKLKVTEKVGPFSNIAASDIYPQTLDANVMDAPE